MRFLLILLFSAFLSHSYASTDSLIIQGKILNLNGRLYRQAPVINFSRNNILQSQSELSKQAPLQADGSFRVSLPLLFATEEIYLDYGGKAFTTFLGSPGTVEITFNGDSLTNAKKLFYFAGVNADANNLFSQYISAENQRLQSNKALGTDFFKTFWQKSNAEAESAASQRAQYRIGTLPVVTQNTVASPVLNKWIRSIAEEEQLQILYEHALSNMYEVGKALRDSLSRLATSPLTSQRVIWANRFGSYADLLVDQKKFSNPTRTSSLPVRLMASLIKKNSPKLTAEEMQRLDYIISNGIAEKTELDFLNKLFAKNEVVLNLLFNFERESRIYGDLFDSTATEFLKVRYLSKNLYKFTYKQQLALSKHIQSRTGIPQFNQSLDELVKLEVKDSADIDKIVNFKAVTTNPVEVLPGYLLSASNDRGTGWLNNTLDNLAGKTVYISKWNLDDDKSRDQLAYIPEIQARVPEDVVFVFIHLPNEEYSISDALLRQYVVRHRLKGIHLFLNNNQAMDLLFRLNPLDPGTFSLIRRNGKFATRNASAPADVEKTVQAILEARK